MAQMSVCRVHHIFLGHTGLHHRGVDQCQASP